MNLKKSWVNIPLLKNIIKQNTLLAKISLIAVIAFSIMGFFGGSFIAALLFGISAVVLTTCYAGIVQKYMTNKVEANFMASLPIDSFVLWFTHYLAGLVLVVLPLWIEALLMSLTVLQMGTRFVGSASNYFIYFQLVTISLAIIYYTMSFFVSCIAGSRLGQFLYTVVLYAIPFSLYFVIAFGSEALAIGDSFLSEGTNEVLYLLVPFASGMQCIEGDGWSYAFIHCIITILFFIGGYYVFKNRSIENTGSAIMYKKVNIVFRTIMVVTISLFIFILLTVFIDVVPNGHINSILIGGCVFVVLGCLMAMMVEIIFKNKHVYKSLLYYIPVFLFSYIGCYMYGSYSYQSIQEEIFDQQQVSMIVSASNGADYSQYNSGEMIRVNRDTVKQLVTELEKKPELLYKDMGTFNPTEYVDISFHLVDDNAADSKSFSLKVDREYFKQVSDAMSSLFEKDVDQTMLDRIISKEQEYWALSDNLGEYATDKDILSMPLNLNGVLTKQEVIRLCEYVNSTKYQKNANLFTQKYHLVAPGEVFTLALDYEFVNTLVEDENIAQRTAQMQECYQEVFDADGEQFDTVLSLYPQLGSRETTRMESFDLLRDYQIIDDNTCVINTRYLVYSTNDNKETIVPCKITFTRQEGEMLVNKVEGGEKQ